jgi:hypothetical protein
MDNKGKNLRDLIKASRNKATELKNEEDFPNKIKEETLGILLKS